MIGLPANLFHGTSVPVVILILKSKRNGDAGNILFIDASREFQKGKNQNELTEDNIRKIIDTYANRVDVEKYAHVATMDEIRENGYNLNIPRYVDTSDKEPEIDLGEVTQKIRKVDEEIAGVSDRLKESFDLLGLDFPF